MIISTDGINVFYERYEGSGTPILLLHGWGASTETMRGIFNFIKSSGKSVISLDFPGFGKSDNPPSCWGIYDYAKVVKNFLHLLNIDKVILLGHSFGGRVSLILAAENLTEKIILVDSAGLKPKFSLKKQIKILKYKTCKKLGLDTTRYGSDDYKNLSPEMRTVFVKVVNEHLDHILKMIKVPTLIIWGEDDIETPLYMAKKINNTITDSGLVVLKNCGHYCFAENYGSFCKILKAFLYPKEAIL